MERKQKRDSRVLYFIVPSISGTVRYVLAGLRLCHSRVIIPYRAGPVAILSRFLPARVQHQPSFRLPRSSRGVKRGISLGFLLYQRLLSMRRLATHSKLTAANNLTLTPRRTLMPRTREILLVYLAAAILHPAISAGQISSETTPLAKQVANLEEKLARDEKTLLDWPNLARYRDANAAITAPANDETRVVFMGDSITDMWVQPQFGGFFPGKPYVDRGISGQTTPQMLIRFRPDGLALQPRVVVILAGTNDIAGNSGPMTLEEIEGNLASMSQLAHANGIHVVLSSLLPVYDGGRTPDGKPLVMTDRRPPEKILALNAWIKNYAAQHHDTYLDYFSATVDDHGFLKKDLSEDGLHPNRAGYAVMARLAETAIAAALHTTK
jgi:lysophospholipase L1-like esterase